jgi:hypothetical protein
MGDVDMVFVLVDPAARLVRVACTPWFDSPYFQNCHHFLRRCPVIIPKSAFSVCKDSRLRPWEKQRERHCPQTHHMGVSAVPGGLSNVMSDEAMLCNTTTATSATLGSIPVRSLAEYILPSLSFLSTSQM